MTEVAEIQSEVLAPEPKPRKRNGDGRAVAKVEAAPTPVAPVSEAAAFLQIIDRASRDPSVDLDKLQRLLDMRERMQAREAEVAFNAAMTEAQKEMRPVSTDSANTQTKSKYASYAALDRVLRPVYTKHGFALSFNTSPDAPADHVRILCDVTNCGHTRRYQIDMPADGKGAKGGDVMTKTHAAGSAASYGMRYLLKMIFNIAVGEADDDGNAAGRTEPVERITEKQVSDLNALLQKSPEPAANVQIIFEHFKIDNLSELTPEQYRKTVSQLSKKLELQGA
jgi:hypothetical protein